MKHLKAIAAMSENRVIGSQGRIPWHIPRDFKWFKRQTLGNVAVMGRKTFEGLPGPLPNRRKLILTRHPRRLIHSHPEVFGAYREWRGGPRVKGEYQLHFTRIDGDQSDDISIFSSLDLIRPDEFAQDVFICGGAEIYAQALPRCSDLYLTLVKRVVEGDAFFPPFEDAFEAVEVIDDQPEFRIVHYRNRELPLDG
ncbi:MAG TPA: dihydrofolate reductase [Methylomirabilota bacterium]|nr:dihydrofolate reductase [Methylomirabilota bacterium]